MHGQEEENAWEVGECERDELRQRERGDAWGTKDIGAVKGVMSCDVGNNI